MPPTDIPYILYIFVGYVVLSLAYLLADLLIYVFTCLLSVFLPLHLDKAQ